MRKLRESALVPTQRPSHLSFLILLGVIMKNNHIHLRGSPRLARAGDVPVIARGARPERQRRRSP